METQMLRATRPLIRPHLLSDEWIETYLGRVARANGIINPWRNDFERLREMFGLPSAASDDGMPKYSREMLPSWAAHGRSAQIRYCPVCFAESRYIRARWRLTAFETCTLHNVMLKTGICEPAITVKYRHPAKRAVSKISAVEVMADAASPVPIARDYANRIWSEFEMNASGLAHSDAAESLAWALLAERLMDCVVTAVRDAGYPPRAALRLHHRAQWLKEHGLQIGASWEGIVGFFSGLTVSRHSRAAYRTLQSLQRDEQKTKTLMSRLPLTELVEKLQEVSLVDLHDTSSQSVPREMYPRHFVTLAHAETAIGCTKHFVLTLVKAGILQRVERVWWHGRWNLFFETSELGKCRQWLEDLISEKELLFRLKIRHRILEVILASGFIRPIEIGSRKRYRQSDLLRMLNQLKNAALPFSRNSRGLQPLIGRWWRRYGISRAAAIQVLTEIWGGKLQVYYDPNESGLSAYYVDVYSVRRVLELTRTQMSAARRKMCSIGQLPLFEAP